MLAILESIISLISSVLMFVVHSVQALISVITSIPQYLSVLTSVFSVLPPIIFPFVIMAVYTMIMLKWVLNKK